MAEALIGYTGFVGGNLNRQHRFDELYNSSNIDEIRGRSFDLVACAGAPAEKWRANQNPEQDSATLARLTSALGEVRTERCLLISTVDVYPHPVEVDEDSSIDLSRCHPYGAHRRELELFVQERFETTTLRLPGLFGSGLKKNFIYDLLHDRMLDQMSPESMFQFYDLENLWADAEKARRYGLDLLNVATEPVAVVEVAEQAFGREFRNPGAPQPVRYDFRSKFDRLWEGVGGYLYSRQDVLTAMRRFVDLHRARQTEETE